MYLFIYCCNNPITSIDENGCIRKGVVKGYGIMYNVSFLFDFSIVVGTYKDSFGNEASFETYVGVKSPGELAELEGGMAGVGATAAYVIQKINTDSVYDMVGVGSYVGGSVSIGASVSYDRLMLDKTVAEIVRGDAPDSSEGWQIAVGLGVGINWVHEGNSFTRIMLIRDKGVLIPEEERVWKYEKQK